MEDHHTAIQSGVHKHLNPPSVLRRFQPGPVNTSQFRESEWPQIRWRFPGADHHPQPGRRRDFRGDRPEDHRRLAEPPLGIEHRQEANVFAQVLPTLRGEIPSQPAGLEPAPDTEQVVSVVGAELLLEIALFALDDSPVHRHEHARQ